MIPVTLGTLLGFIAWFAVRYVLAGFYTVDQNERAVKTRFGRAVRLGKTTTLDDPIADYLNQKDKERYIYPDRKSVV